MSGNFPRGPCWKKPDGKNAFLWRNLFSKTIGAACWKCHDTRDIDPAWGNGVDAPKKISGPYRYSAQRFRPETGTPSLQEAEPVQNPCFLCFRADPRRPNGRDSQGRTERASSHR